MPASTRPNNPLSPSASSFPLPLANRVRRFFESVRGTRAAAAFLIIGFAALQLSYPRLPGIDFGDGLLMDQYLAGQIREMLRDNSFWDLFRRGELPAARDTYHGTLMAYLYLPFLALFGRSWMVAKHWPLFWAVLTLVFSFLFMRNIFGRRAALLSLLLLVVHPSYVMGIREGSALLSHMQFFSMGSLCFLSFWWTTRRTAWFALAMAFLGLGQSTQLWFAWFVAGLAVAGLIFAADLRARFDLRGKKAVRWTLLGIFCVVAGGALIVYREITQDFASVQAVLSKWTHFGDAPEPASYYFEGLWRNIKRFSAYLASRSLIEATFTFKPDEPAPLYPFANPLYPWFVLAAALSLFTPFARRADGKAGAALVVIPAVMLMFSGFSHVGGPHLHFFFLYPFPQLILGAALAAAETASPKRAVRIGGAALLAVVLVTEILTLGAYLRRFVTVRHGALYTDVIYEVADWLRETNRTSGPFAVADDAEETLRRLYFILPDSDFRPVPVNIRPESPPEATTEAVASLREAARSGDLLFVRYVNEVHTAQMEAIRDRLNPHVEFERLREFLSPRNELAFEVYLLKLRAESQRREPAS